MTERFTYRHWRELQQVMVLVVTLGLGAGALWFIAVMGVCTVLEAYRVQEPLCVGGVALVIAGGLGTVVRTFLSLEKTVVQVESERLTVLEPQAAPRSVSYAEIKSVQFAKQALGGFHRVVESTRVIDVTTVTGDLLRVDIHNGWWGGIRTALARHLPDERLGNLPW